LISVKMSGLLYRLFSSLLDLIRHVPFIHTGPYILRKIFIYQDMRVAVDFSKWPGFITEKDRGWIILQNCVTA
jgi:hypothetical protein